MKTKTIKKVWESYEQKWMSKDFSDLIVNVDGKICVRFFNGTVGAVPQKMMHLLPPNLVNELAEKANARSIETARRIAAEREEREKRLDESGFHLLAGENTDIIHSGTWRECRNNLFKLLTHKLPKDSYSGKGCWVIVKDGEEFESGYFSADTYWQTR